MAQYVAARVFTYVCDNHDCHSAYAEQYQLGGSFEPSAAHPNCSRCDTPLSLLRAQYEADDPIVDIIPDGIIHSIFENQQTKRTTIFFKGFVPGNIELTLEYQKDIKLGYRDGLGRSYKKLSISADNH